MSGPSEVLDIVDEQGEVVGQATRGECHNNPKLIHRVVHCWIFNNQGQILWQQRSLKKDSSPGVWDMSCGGHVLSEEKPQATMARELKEELGLEDVDFQFVERYIRASPDGKQTEMIYLYYAIVSQPEHYFRFSDREVEQVKWTDVDKAMMSYLKSEVQATDFIISQLPKILQFRISQQYSKRTA